MPKTRLGDVIRIKHGYAFPGTDFSEDPNFPTVLTPGNFAIGGGFKRAQTKTFAGDVPNEFVLKPGSVVVTMTDLSKNADTLGLPAVVPQHGEFLHNQRIGLIEVLDPQSTDTGFLNYLLRTAEYRRQVVASASGTTVRHTSPSRIEELELFMPNTRNQRAIAKVLGALDDKIAANAQILRVIDQLVASRFRLVADERAVVNLREMAAVNRAVTNPERDGELRYLDISSVGQGTYEYPAASRWSDAPGRARRVISPGDTVWSTVRPNRRSHALIFDDDQDLIGSTGLAVLSPNPGRVASLYEATKQERFGSYLESVAEGSAYPAVRGDRFLDAPIPDLAREEWDDFDSYALPLRQRAHAATIESRRLAQARDEILPLLMSGKIGVRDAKTEVDEML